MSAEITFDLPDGFDTIEDLATNCDASRAWLVRRTLPRFVGGEEDAHGTIYSGRDYYPEDADLDHGDTRSFFLERFNDGSLWVHSNAADEIWNDASDYAEHVGLGPIVWLDGGHNFTYRFEDEPTA